VSSETRMLSTLGDDREMNTERGILFDPSACGLPSGQGACQADQDDVLDNQSLTHTVGPSSGHPLSLSQQFMQRKRGQNSVTTEACLLSDSDPFRGSVH
jgi:hypothetical protein